MSTGATYDANGDVLTDSLHSYAWDVETRPTTIDTVTATYDALGRTVEQTNSGTSTEIVYDCMGNKLALMNTTSTVVKGFAPLPGGGTAVYNASGLQYYRHPDWLGSSRFSSTPSRTMYNDLAYAPFGEQYAAAGTTGITNVSFAGNNEDTTTNLYDARFREYEIYGRWPSPDPAGISAANPANPQSWNRYAYVMNNPLLFVDPFGLMPNHGCLAAGHRGGGVRNYSNCGSPTGNCSLDGAVVPCGSGDGSGGSGFGGVQTQCIGELNYQTCFVFDVGDPDGPSSGDLCGGGDCFSGPGSPQSPTPPNPKQQQCVQAANARADNTAGSTIQQSFSEVEKKHSKGCSADLQEDVF